MHKDMYTAFAASDVETLRRICAEGLLGSLRTRISHRAPNERFDWTLHQMIGKPRVVSNRAAMLPFGKESALRQVVVKIRSRQSLGRKVVQPGAKGKNVPSAPARNTSRNAKSSNREDSSQLGSTSQEDLVISSHPGEEKEVTEYVVIQRRMWNGKEEPWILWGLTEETPLEAVVDTKAT